MNLIKNHKILYIKLLCIIIFTISSHLAFGQLFSGGQNPPGVKFNQINTPGFQIIYPTLLEDDAQKMANVLELIIRDVSHSLGRTPQPISIILQNRGVESNGFVQMAPRRSEFYTIPSQEFDAQDWLNSLAVHELRHVVQFDKLGPNLKAPFFEELKLALFGINLPPWFFEGDAVGIETALTPAGRGRQPSFEMVLRTNILSGKKYSYSKNYLGSFKDFTPGYYPLGYFMTTKIRRDFGGEILDKILRRIAQFPIRPYNFSSSLKKYGGYSTKELHSKTMLEMDSLWSAQSLKSERVKYMPLNKEDTSIPTSYLFPYAMNDDKIICLKQSKAQTPAITVIEGNSEIRIISIGSQTEPNIHYAANRVVWDEYRADKRYEKQSFNVICIYNLVTHTYKQLTKKSRYFSPALSSDGSKIIAVKVSLENKFNLVELDATSGRELKTYPNPENFTLQTPQFNQNNTQVIVTAVNQEGKTLILYDTENLSSKILFDPERQIIFRPTFYQNEIIYKAHYNGTDNIYSFNLSSGIKSKLTSSQFGAFNPSISKNQDILFNDYQAQGHNIVKINLSTLKTKKTSQDSNYFVEYFKPLKSQENSSNVFKEIPTHTFEVKPYHEFNNLLYFHSIRPVVAAAEFENDYKIGFDLASNNKLNTLAITAGYQYNSSLRANEFSASLVYQKYYPILSLSYNNEARLAYVTDELTKITLPFQWRENRTKFGIILPYYKNWLNKSIYAGLEISTSYTDRYNLTTRLKNFSASLNFPMQYKLFWSFNTLRSARDLASPLGANFSINYQHLPLEKNLNGKFASLRTQFYTPGLFINHSFQFSINFQESKDAYQFNSDIARASGYAQLSPLKKLYNSLLFDYRFPIAYPDWELGPIAYIKRFKGGFFADFENIGKGHGLRSYGAELRADVNFLRFYLPTFDLSSKIIIPAEKSITKNPIFEVGLTYSF